MQRTTTLRQARRAGFTLLELLIVLAILGVIAAMVAPNLLGTQQKAMIKTAVAEIQIIEGAAKTYAVEHDAEYPSGAEGINLLLNPPEKNGQAQKPYLEKVPQDPWGQAYNYEFPTTKQKIEKPAIWSNGPNKKNDGGSGDDIKNWQ